MSPERLQRSQSTCASVFPDIIAVSAFKKEHLKRKILIGHDQFMLNLCHRFILFLSSWISFYFVTTIDNKTDNIRFHTLPPRIFVNLSLFCNDSILKLYNKFWLTEIDLYQFQFFIFLSLSICSILRYTYFSLKIRRSFS